MITQMDRHIDTVISKNEQTFLSAYSQTMKRLQREIQAMRDKMYVKERETSLDSRIMALQRKLQWFQREALLQQEENKRLKDQVKGLEMRCALIKEEKSFFQKNAVESKRGQLMLRAALAKSIEK
jgi:hypothetical protein